MPTGVKNKTIEPAPFAVTDVSREPQQGRSQASLKRMLEATRDLMLQRGSEEFTLQEVSEQGQVSIGSIYLRFESKDNLVRGVIAQALESLEEDETRLMAQLDKNCTNLASLVSDFVDGYAEVLRKHAPLLRLTMERAEHDPLVAKPGRAHALRAERQAAESMLKHAAEFGGRDAADYKLKAQSGYHVIFATLARQLSLGSSGEAVHAYDWNQMKQELARMCLAYLRAD